MKYLNDKMAGKLVNETECIKIKGKIGADVQTQWTFNNEIMNLL